MRRISPSRSLRGGPERRLLGICVYTMNQTVRRDMDSDYRISIAICLLIAIALGGCATTERKAASVSYGLSGFEIFIGDREGNRTTGALFSGWVHDTKPGWQSE